MIPESRTCIRRRDRGVFACWANCACLSLMLLLLFRFEHTTTMSRKSRETARVDGITPIKITYRDGSRSSPGQTSIPDPPSLSQGQNSLSTVFVIVMVTVCSTALGDICDIEITVFVASVGTAELEEIFESLLEVAMETVDELMLVRMTVADS